MREILVDSNVILDVVTEDTTWFEWSSGQIARLAEDHVLVINPIVYSEVSVGFERIEEVDSALPVDFFRREALPWEAAFLAAKCFLRYRRAGGRKRSPLPDFYVGAHAAVRGLPLLTRDARRYRTYFPRLTLVAP
ncbi:MAG: type II toxin-antitoxin system VapC family toxin [Candidatus Rokubacteria bacterium]|nr:type II toxin-antitoxin system VapC family toxin [Candidatus Rokubacteria bacterium]